MKRTLLPQRMMSHPWTLIAGLALELCGSGIGHGAVTDPSTLLQQGKFREAQTAYEAMADKNPQDARWRYNAGVAAFRAGDATTAQKHFEAAAGAADLGLQQRAWFNLGNSWFQQASTPESEDREAALKKAEEAFGAAAQLAPEDRAATENLAAVKKLAEELRKQEQQEQQSEDGKKDPKKNQGQKDKKDQKGQKGKSGKDGKSDSPSEKSEDSESNQAKNSGDKSQPKDPAKTSAKKQPVEDKPSGEANPGEGEKKPDVAHQPTNAPAGGAKTNQTAQAGGDPSKDKTGGEKGGIQRGEGSAPAGAEGPAAQLAEGGERMTVMQAQQMLDAQKGAEKPIWTLVRGWGQENQPPPSSSAKRKKW